MYTIIDFLTPEDHKKDKVAEDVNNNFKKKTKELLSSNDPKVKEQLFSHWEEDKKKVKEELKKNILDNLTETGKRYSKNKDIKAYCDEKIKDKLKEFDDLLTKEEEKRKQKEKEDEYRREIYK